MCVIVFTPESPRWLIDHDRHEEALEVLAVVNSGGDKSDPLVLVQYKEIADTIQWEKTEGQQLTLVDAYKYPANRRRLMIAISFACIVMLPGTNIVTYYFGTMLAQGGITDPTTQLQINIILTAWSLIHRCRRFLLCRPGEPKTAMLAQSWWRNHYFLPRGWTYSSIRKLD